MFCTLLLLGLSSAGSLFAIVTGNPGEPALLSRGIAKDKSRWSFRLGYMGDYVYKQDYKEEFQLDNCTTSISWIKMYTNAAVLTFNAKKRLDLYSILGATRIEIDKETFSKTRFSWGFGVKAIVFKHNHLLIGADIKYFESDQKPLYFTCDHLAYNILGDYILNYREIQGSLGVSYQTKYVAPYINGSYISSKIQPVPSMAFVRLPTSNLVVDVMSKSIISEDRWGLSIGATLLDHKRATLALEWRVLNQNSIDVFGEVRF